MTTQTALKMLVEEMHSAAVATIGDDGKPQIRAVDMMYYDERGVYFLTARGKNFYRQLTAQKYVALTAVKGKKSVSLRGDVKSVGQEKLDIILERNPYMQKIYPEGTRGALEVFLLYNASGEYFDISNPSEVIRYDFATGGKNAVVEAYYAGNSCTGCKKCLSVCPQKCINVARLPAVIEQSRCLHCGNCAAVCPQKAIQIKEITI